MVQGETASCPECCGPLDGSKSGLSLTFTCPACGFSCATTDQDDPSWGKTRHDICAEADNPVAIAKVAVMLGFRALDLSRTLAEGRPAAINVPTLQAREIIAQLRACGVDAWAEPPLDDGETGLAS